MVFKDPDDIFDEEGDSKTAFNSALDIIQRISRLEYSLAASLLYEKLRESYQLLILIHTEIDFKLNSDQRKDLEKKEGEIDQKLKEAEEKFPFEGKIFIKNPELRKEVLNQLIELKKIIGRYKYSVGLGMIDMSDPRYALLNG